MWRSVEMKICGVWRSVECEDLWSVEICGVWRSVECGDLWRVKICGV